MSKIVAWAVVNWKHQAFAIREKRKQAELDLKNLSVLFEGRELRIVKLVEEKKRKARK